MSKLEPIKRFLRNTDTFGVTLEFRINKKEFKHLSINSNNKCLNLNNASFLKMN